MKKSLFSFFQKMTGIMVGMVAVAVLAFFVVTHWNADGRTYILSWTQILDSDWCIVMDNGQKIPVEYPVNLDTPKGQTVKFETILPETLQDDAVLTMITAKSTDYYIDGLLRYRYTSEDNYLPGLPVKSFPIQFSLCRDDAGKTLTVVRRDPNEYNGNLPQVIIGDTYGVFRYYFDRYGMNLIAAVILIMLAVATILLNLVMCFMYHTSPDSVLLALGLAAVGFWMLFDNVMYEYVFGIVYADGVLSFLTTALIPFPFLFYLDRVQKRRHTVVFFASKIALLINAVFFAFLHFSTNASYIDTMFANNSMIGVVIGIIFYYIITDMVKGYDKEYHEVSIGFIGLLIFSAVELIQLNLPDHNNSAFDGVFLLMGMFFLLIQLIMMLCRRSNQVRVEAARVARANEMKSSFLANMSHEIRTPVNAIVGMDELILREEISPAVREYATNIQSASESLLAIINDILDFAKIESDRMELVEEHFELPDVISDVVTITSVGAESKKLAFVVEADESLPVGLHGDAVKLRQIMVNILNNAVKYTREGTVSLRVSGETAGGELVLKITVSDTGQGIRKEDLSRLFEMFTRLDEHVNRSIEGTGLGLSIVKKYVEMLNGTIDVDSEFGKGTTFTVTIRQVIDDPTPMGSLAVHNKSTGPKKTGKGFLTKDARILVVDDNQMNLNVVKGLLRGNRILVDCALSGLSALEFTRTTKYDMIFLDHMMPEPDGVETLHRMKAMEDNPNVNTPVLVLTANAIKGAKERYLEEGFDDYLPKPIYPNELEQMILKYLPKEKLVEQGETVLQEDMAGNEKQILQRLFSGKIDMETGLIYCADSMEMYIEMLKGYFSEGEERKKKLVMTCEEADWNGYRIAAHSLTSTSLTIGATHLSGLAKELEMAAKEEKSAYIAEHNDALLMEYNDILECIRVGLEQIT